ncbi:unnamed protein product [Urochloa humidicola]
MGHEEERRARAGHLLFPFLSQGHLIPFLNLAKHLESHGQRGGIGQHRLEVTIISMPRNVASQSCRSRGRKMSCRPTPRAPMSSHSMPSQPSTSQRSFSGFP